MNTIVMVNFQQHSLPQDQGSANKQLAYQSINQGVENQPTPRFDIFSFHLHNIARLGKINKLKATVFYEMDQNYLFYTIS